MPMSPFKKHIFISIAIVASAGAAYSSHADEMDGGSYLSKLMDQRLVTLSGHCMVSVKPDFASITVVLDGEGSTPDEAHQMLAGMRDKTLALIAKHHGRHKQQEILRMMRSSDPVSAPIALSSSGPSGAQPSSANIFVFSQRLDLEFPLAADVDAVLHTLNKMDIKRIGRHAVASATVTRSAQPQPVVFYGFSDPEKMAEVAHQQCRLQAVENWCKTKATVDHQSKCIGEIKRSLNRFTTQNMSLHSISRNPGYTGSGNISLSYPFKPTVLAQMVLVGREPVELSGTINLRHGGLPN